jgi:hypothetical protein
MNNKIESCGIIERIEHKELFRSADLSGMGHQALVSFHADIGYLVDQHCRADAEHNDVELYCVSAFGDVGRFGRSVTDEPTDVMDDVKRFCSKYNIVQSSTLEVVVRASQTVTPILYDLSKIEKGIWGRLNFVTIPKEWSANKKSMQTILDWKQNSRNSYPEDHGDPLLPFERANEIIWRSNWSPEQNQAAREAYIQKYILTVLPAKNPRPLPSP